MIFIFGGRNQGKLDFAKTLTCKSVKVCNLVQENINDCIDSDIIINIHVAIRRILESGGDPIKIFSDHMESFNNKILIGDEIGCGVVPIDALEREWRDETGRIYQLIAANSAKVYRVWAGLAQILKGE